MKAIILNSGVGSRLGKYTRNNPKCMVEIEDGITIIKRQIDLLKKAGVEEVIITTGYMEDKIKEHLKYESIKLIYVYNNEYNSTNYIKSLDKVSDIDDDVILMHGDLVFEESVLSDVMNSMTSCMVVDKSLNLPDKDFKAVIKEDKIIYVGIDCFENACAAQPLYKLFKSEWQEWKNAIQEFCKEGNNKVYAENALNTITDKINICPLNINGRLCSEIDNEEDLLNIKSLLQGGNYE